MNQKQPEITLKGFVNKQIKNVNIDEQTNVKKHFSNYIYQKLLEFLLSNPK